MSTAANFPLTACETLNFRLQKLLLFLVRKILAQRLIAEINLYGAISRMRLPEMDHWLCSTICMLNPLEQKIFARAVSLKSHIFLYSSKKNTWQRSATGDLDVKPCQQQRRQLLPAVQSWECATFPS